ncbi:M23 family metallopeptidase [Streptomyces sp. NPDC058417]|uniref:M23 family metallopeptidase n=1 Tax=unclassified Streptomyces TaxID=2593676 RepID=UPI00364900CB
MEEQADVQAGAAEAAAVAQEAAERRTAERQEARAAQQRLLEERLAADKARQERAERKRPAPGAPVTAGSVVLPLADVKLSARFGDKGELWSSGEHTGLDFVAPTGTELMAVHDATVTRVTSGGALGNHTVLRLEDGTEVRYSHQDSVAVEEGQKVKAGEVIGAVGDTGNTTGPHLHLEVVDAAGDFIDPEAWFAEQGLSL